MTAETYAPIRTFRILRRVWLLGTILLSLGAFALAIGLAPTGSESPSRGLGSLLFLGSSVHVAATAWFYSLPEIRAHAMAHKERYVVVPLALTGVVATLTAPDRVVTTWLRAVIFEHEFDECGFECGFGGVRSTRDLR